MTHLVMVLDGSGSMYARQHEVRTGYDEFVQKTKDDNAEATLSVYLFDDRINRLVSKMDVNSAPKGDEVYHVGGMTALYDAIGKALIENEEDWEDMAVMVLTDGYENASSEFNSSSLKELVDRFEKAGGDLRFVGAEAACLDQTTIWLDQSKAINTMVASKPRGYTDTLSEEFYGFTTSYMASKQEDGSSTTSSK